MVPASDSPAASESAHNRSRRNAYRSFLAFGLLILELLVCDEHNCSQDECDEQRPAYQSIVGRTGVTAFRVMFAHGRGVKSEAMRAGVNLRR